MLLEGKPGGDYMEDTGVEEMIIVSWIFRKLDAGHRLDRTGLGLGQVAGSCECTDEQAVSIKNSEFFDKLRRG